MAKVEQNLSKPKEKEVAPIVYQKKIANPEYDPYEDWDTPINSEF